MRLLKILFIAVLVTVISACGEAPSSLIFKGGEFDLIASKKSSGGQFKIHEYSGDIGAMYLIQPLKEADLDQFSKLYTETFKAQGFKFEHSGNRHLGKTSSNYIYVTVAKQLEMLSILLVSKNSGFPSSISSSSGFFIDLQSLM